MPIKQRGSQKHQSIILSRTLKPRSLPQILFFVRKSPSVIFHFVSSTSLNDKQRGWNDCSSLEYLYLNKDTNIPEMSDPSFWPTLSKTFDNFLSILFTHSTMFQTRSTL